MCKTILAAYATNPDKSRGRLYPEQEDGYRNNFEKDRERIIHCNAFKRLEYKTQVFVNHIGDHYRNRLTHSLEAANVARIIARKMALSEDLAECIALAHDLGHPPFGHAGEDALNGCMNDFGGFCHNNFAIKLLTQLEKKYVAFDGLNLSVEVLEGIAKHNGPLLDTNNKAKCLIFEYNDKQDLSLKSLPSLEAQVASISDDIAYNAHDLEDGIRAGIFEIDELSEISFIEELIESTRKNFAKATKHQLIYEAVRALSKTLIQDVVNTTTTNIEKYRIETLNDVKSLKLPLVHFSPETQILLSRIQKFLFTKFYRNHKINIMSFKCKKVVKELFKLYFDNPACMPLDWQKRITSDAQKPFVVSDYIAGMTDGYAIKEYESFYYLTSKNI